MFTKPHFTNPTLFKTYLLLDIFIVILKFKPLASFMTFHNNSNNLLQNVMNIFYLRYTRETCNT